MAHHRIALATLMGWVVVLVVFIPACLFDSMGTGLLSPDGDGDVDGDIDGDGDGDGDGDTDGDGDGDGDADGDGDSDGDADEEQDTEPPPECEDGEMECASTGASGDIARLCTDGRWVSAARCFFGCDADSRSCFIPSNVDMDTIPADEATLGDVSLPEGALISVSTTDGSIYDHTAGESIREAGEGFVLGGIGFFRHAQSDDAPMLGIILVRSLHVPAGTTVEVNGDAALALIATGDVTIDGVIDGGAHAALPGPGGGAGGAVETIGGGLCPGHPGVSASTCARGCASGSGGGGNGGRGGDGGRVDCTVGDAVVLTEGLGGGPCGTIELIPLQGGSGGGGGVSIGEQDPTTPGEGGGGGGALQFTVRGTLTLGESGVLAVPGDGGGECVTAGGSGGGAGGSLLIEATTVIVTATSSVVANGGGGGGGD